MASFLRSGLRRVAPQLTAEPLKAFNVGKKTTHQPFEDLRVVRLIVADREAVIDFMQKDFRMTEPLMGSLGISERDARHFFAKTADYTIVHPISFSMKRPDGQIVGLCLNTFLSRPKEGEREEPVVLDNRLANYLVGIVHDCRAKIWDHLPENVTKVVDFTILSVDSSYGRRGIGSRLVDALFKEDLKAQGAQGIVAELSNPKSQQLFTKKYGFEDICGIDYANWCGNERWPVFDSSNFHTDRIMCAWKAI